MRARRRARARQASTPNRLTADSTLPADANDPIDPIEKADPMDPIEANDPIDPMDANEPTLPMLRAEPRDRCESQDAVRILRR